MNSGRSSCWFHRVFRWLRIPGIAALLLFALWLLLPPCGLLPEGITWSRQVHDRGGELLKLTLSGDGKYRLWTPLAEMPRPLIAATLAHEDHRFNDHAGVDVISLGRAVWGVLSGAPRGGASTLTMQLARLRFGLNTKTVAGKAEQMLRAIQLERHYSKDQILEAYLNLAPYGGNVEGIGAAAVRWMGRKPAELTFHECVAFSLVPQRPFRRGPGAGEPDAAFPVLQARLCALIRGAGLPGDDAFRLPATRRPLPGAAPHAVRLLLRRFPEAPVLQSSLDSRMQEILEHSITDFVHEWGGRGVRNACAMLVHAPSREIRASVGSADFSSARISGQIDGVMARRSPGSLLKPFIYGLAIDQGLIHPASLLSDAPAVFGEYRPENFDRGFTGPVTAAEALYRSRNLPAVNLMAQLKAPGFYGFLIDGGVALTRPAGYYGLTLTLGGAEIRMDEAAALYAMLAADGTYRPLSWTAGQSGETGRRLLSPAACYCVRTMLMPPQPALPGEAYTAGFGHVSWKTGTSHGFRDAWAAGICGDHVLLVWVGDFDGRSNGDFTGRTTAGPLLFQALARLDLDRVDRPVPEGLTKTDLCAVSGHLPGPHCGHHKSGWYLPGVSPVASCELHQEIFMDGATGLRVAANDGRPGLVREVYECWPPEMLELFRKAGLPRRALPPMESSAVPMAGGSLRITSPQSSLTYSLRASHALHRTIPLRVDAAAGVRSVFWFAGNEFLGSCDPGQPLEWKAAPGVFRIRAVDDCGRSSTTEVRVEMLP